jgi:hypothetical protein
MPKNGMAIKTKQDPEIYYRYGQMLKSNGKYAESRWKRLPL